MSFSDHSLSAEKHSSKNADFAPRDSFKGFGGIIL